MNTKTNPAVAGYLARTQAALADLPASEVQEILEDIGPHLSEIAAEVGEDVTVDALTERLGTPEQYAAELRAAAGYPPAEPAPRAVRARTLLPRFALWALVFGVLVAFVAGLAGTLPVTRATMLLLSLPLLAVLPLVFTGRVDVSAVADLPESRAWRRVIYMLPDAVLAYVRSLRPAWWLVRIVLLAGGFLVALPRPASAADALLSVIALAVLLLFGSRSRTDRRWRWVVAPANAFAAGIGLALLGSAWAHAAGPFGAGVPQTSTVSVVGGVSSNIYPFGPDGKPLREVYLYDQNGLPIMMWPDTCAGSSEPSNKFPQPRRGWDHVNNMCKDLTDVPFTVAIPTTTAPPPTTPTGK